MVVRVERVIDTCGLACPEPVSLVKEVVNQQLIETLIVLVDDGPSRENVTRFLDTNGYKVTANRQGGEYRLTAVLDRSKEKREEDEDFSCVTGGSSKILVMIMTDRLGNGDDELGQKLMINYLKTLKEMGSDLWQIVFVNSGVKLTIRSSPVLEELQEYEKSGVVILACGTCLEHFGLSSDKEVGGATNMLDIVTATHLADKVITIS